MQFDIFYQLPVSADQNTAQRYREMIEEAVEADRLGFGTVWLAEIHFMPKFCVLPAPMMLLAAIAERTQRIKLGQAVNLLPLHHPVRLAEEAATLDVISNGRLAFGAGRGGFPINYHGFGVDIRESRAIMHEFIDFLKRAWTEETLSYHSDRYNFDGVEIIPKPVQKPYPTIRVAANTPDTFTFAGAHGYPIFAGGPVNPINVIGERLKLYQQARIEAGHDLPDDWFASLMMVFAGRDRAAVRTLIEPSLRNYFTTVSEIMRPETLNTSGAEFDKVRARMRDMSYETIDSLMGIFGDPAYCIDRITELRECFNFTRMVCWIEVGGLSGHQNVLDSMRLFADRVMPHFA
jgi:natural product biosynthesis luciferase-like monooxygenase protein